MRSALGLVSLCLSLGQPALAKDMQEDNSWAEVMAGLQTQNDPVIDPMVKAPILCSRNSSFLVLDERIDEIPYGNASETLSITADTKLDNLAYLNQVKELLIELGVDYYACFPGVVLEDRKRKIKYFRIDIYDKANTKNEPLYCVFVVPEGDLHVIGESGGFEPTTINEIQLKMSGQKPTETAQKS